MDQGVFNGVFQPLHKVELLLISYDAQTACYDLGYKGLQSCRNPVWPYTEYEINDPHIAHFTTCFMSGTRPWFKNDKHVFRNEFLKYRSMTKWKDEPLWYDNTMIAEKIMTKISNILPKSLTFLIIRVVHTTIYLAIINVKNGL